MHCKPRCKTATCTVTHHRQTVHISVQKGALLRNPLQYAEAVIRRAQLIAASGASLELNHVLYGQYGVALSIHNQARRGELVLDEHLATVCSLRDGKIAAIDTYLSDVEMVNAFFTA